MKISISNNNLKKNIEEDCKNRGSNKETSGTVFLKTDNSFDENKTANVTWWLLELFCGLFVCFVWSGVLITLCHKQNPWILLYVCHKNTIGSYLNIKTQLV